MKLAWTKNTSPVSKAIRYGLKEPVSHFVLVFDNKIVFHSNLLGAHVEWWNTFKKHNTVVFEKEYPLSLEQEEIIYQSIVNNLDGLHYDFLALAFFTGSVFLNRIFNVPMPNINNWQNKDALLCTELLKALPLWLDNKLSYFKDKDVEIISPYKIYQVLNGSLTL